MNFSNVVLVLAISHGFLLSLFILKKNRRFLPNKILFFFITVCNLILFNLLYTDLKLEMKFPYIPLVLDSLVYLPGPLFYQYVKYVLAGLKRFQRIDFLHYLPYLIYLIITVPDYFKPEIVVINSFKEIYTDHPPFMSIVFNWSIFFQIIIYLFLAYYNIYKYSNKITQYYSSVDEFNTNWMKILVVVFLFGILVFGAENALFSFGINLSNYFTLSSVIFGISIYSFGYFGLIKADGLFCIDFNELKIFQSEEKKKYVKSGLEPEKANEICNKLLKLMDTEKPFLDSSFNLQKLANRLKVPSYYLSEVLNVQLKKSFYEFINFYRINEVRKILEENIDKNRNILEIAYACGFNSKSTFNKFFKKYYGVTPSEYRDRVLKDRQLNIS